MKSIKTNPNSAKGPNKGKIINKLYCILLATLKKRIYKKVRCNSTVKIRPKEDTKLCLRVEKWSRSV